MHTPLTGITADRAGDGLVSLVVSVDDTDDETRATSTGEIASLIASAATALGGSLRLEVTRHQLLLRDDVPYTSHNSSMAFEALVPSEGIADLYAQAVQIIAVNRAPTSDPGLCFACVPDTHGNEAFTQLESLAVGELVAFGRHAKVDFCSARSAYELASRIPWVALSEHGGDGSGVVGALAGVGLRLGGDDGRFRGKWDFSKLCAGESAPNVGMVARRLAYDFRGPVKLVDAQGGDLPCNLPFSLAAEGKPILHGGALTVVCDVVDGIAYPCSKIDLGDIGNAGDSWSRVCAAFEWDNDEGECLDPKPSCKNCLYRRWVTGGFQCVKAMLAR